MRTSTIRVLLTLAAIPIASSTTSSGQSFSKLQNAQRATGLAGAPTVSESRSHPKGRHHFVTRTATLLQIEPAPRV